MKMGSDNKRHLSQNAKRCILLVSGVAFLLLCTAHGKSVLIMNVVLLLTLAAGIWFIRIPGKCTGGGGYCPAGVQYNCQRSVSCCLLSAME